MMNAKDARALTDNAFPILMEHIEAEIKKCALNGWNKTYIDFVALDGDLLDKVQKSLKSIGYKIENSQISW